MDLSCISEDGLQGTPQGNGARYTSLTAWQAGQQGTLTTQNVAECYSFSTYLDDSIEIGGWVTTDVNNIVLRAAVGHEYDHVAGTGFRVKSQGFGNGYTVKVLSAHDVSVYDICIEGRDSWLQAALEYNNNAANRLAGEVHRCTLISHGGNPGQPCFQVSRRTRVNTRNCLMLATARETNCWLQDYRSPVGTHENNTYIATDPAYQGAVFAYSANSSPAQPSSITNCVAYWGGTGVFSTATFWENNSDATYISMTNDEGKWTDSATRVTGVTDADFVDVASENFNPEPLGLVDGSVNAGADLSGTFTDDITGAIRVAPWERGAYEIAAALDLPEITQQPTPSSDNVELGESSSSTTAATNADSSQWYKGTPPNTSSPVVGQTTDTLSLTNIQAEDDGTYFNRYTNTDGYKDTSVFTLNVNVPLVTNQSTLSSDGLKGTISGDGQRYTSYVAWESGQQKDLVAAGAKERLELFADWPTGLLETVDISGWTTSADNDITVEPASGQEHGGVYGNGFKLGAPNWAAGGSVLVPGSAYQNHIGYTIESQGYICLNPSSCSYAVFDSLFLNNTASNHAFSLYESPNCIFRNSVVLDSDVNIYSGDNFLIENITVKDDITWATAPSALGVINNTAAEGFLVGSGSVTGDRNATVDSSSTGTGFTNGITGLNKTTAGVDFIDPGAKDWRPQPSGKLDSAGATRSGYDYDITGYTRIAPWEIGAYEIAGAAPGAELTLPTVTPAETSALIGCTTDTAGGTLYWYVSQSATAPSAADLKAGTGAVSSGSFTPDLGANTVNATGLTASTQYWHYWIQETT